MHVAHGGDGDAACGGDAPEITPTKVRWALFIATSVPVPIAMPTFARASAGRR